MMYLSVPANKYGLAMQRCIERAAEEMKADIDAHQEGDRMYPEDVEECECRVQEIWNDIKSLRNKASLSLLVATEQGSTYEFMKDDALVAVAKNAILLEFIDQELGFNTASAIGGVLGYVMSNPILNFPDGGARVYH